jgi:hypothetical protein
MYRSRRKEIKVWTLSRFFFPYIQLFRQTSRKSWGVKAFQCPNMLENLNNRWCPRYIRKWMQNGYASVDQSSLPGDYHLRSIGQTLNRTTNLKKYCNGTKALSKSCLLGFDRCSNLTGPGGSNYSQEPTSRTAKQHWWDIAKNTVDPAWRKARKYARSITNKATSWKRAGIKIRQTASSLLMHKLKNIS